MISRFKIHYLPSILHGSLPLFATLITRYELEAYRSLSLTALLEERVGGGVGSPMLCTCKSKGEKIIFSSCARLRRDQPRFLLGPHKCDVQKIAHGSEKREDFHTAKKCPKQFFVLFLRLDECRIPPPHPAPRLTNAILNFSIAEVTTNRESFQKTKKPKP